jgi:hypothetical protein
MQALSEKQKSSAVAATGLKTAVNILDRWNATSAQVQAILRISRATYFKAKKVGFEAISLDSDQLARISVILNIHAALRVIFDNPDNIYGFMNMINNNAYFNGRSPLDSMGDGSFPALYETFKRIDTLRSAQW